jgi:hypothetical protein
VRSTTASPQCCYRPVAATPLTLGCTPDILERRRTGLRGIDVKGRLLLGNEATFPDISTTAPAGQLGTLLVGPQTRGDGNVDGWALTAP